MFRLNTITMAVVSSLYLTTAQAIPGHALPTGGKVTQGQAQIQQPSTNQLSIQQQSQKAVIDWHTFNIGQNASVEFQQPNVQASTLNRVAQGSSEIAGQLKANGQVYLLNPNGVLFTPTARVNTGSLVVATATLTDDEYLKGEGTLQHSANGKIINQGQLTTAQGGQILLSSRQVENQGQIQAQQGQVQLLAGQKVRLNVTADGLIQTELPVGQYDGVINNHGTIRATGGQVDLLASGEQSQILHSGLIEAQSLVEKEGRIYLVAGYEGQGIVPTTGTTRVDGHLDASAPNGGDGGFVETSAGQVHIGDHTQVTTQAPTGRAGTWLIDPQDFNIAAIGGDISGTTLSNNLVTGNVTILSSSGADTAGQGNININDDISYNVNHLTLTAASDINVNAIVSVNGTGTLELNTSTANGSDTAIGGGQVNMNLSTTGFTGRVDFQQAGDGLLTINGTGYRIINSLGTEGSTTGFDLQGMALSGVNYAIGQNIDASATQNWNGGLGFQPIGTVQLDAFEDIESMQPFTGNLHGLGHTIDGLFINHLPSSANPTINELSQGTGVGLIGVTTNNRISNIGVTNVNVTGFQSVGGLVGGAILTTQPVIIDHTYVTGKVQGGGYVGGLVGWNGYQEELSPPPSTITSEAYIQHSYSLADVSGVTHIGGLVGANSALGFIGYSYSDGTISGIQTIDFDNDDIVIGVAGGLVGENLGTITRSYSNANVSAGVAGGLVGMHSAEEGSYGISNTATISHSYAKGQVRSDAANALSAENAVAGGLVGAALSIDDGVTIITDSYATGSVSGVGGVGGLVGGTYADNEEGGSPVTTIRNSYWDIQSSGHSNGIGWNDADYPSQVQNVVGLNSTQMRQLGSFGNWGTTISDQSDSNTIWRIQEGVTTPLLNGMWEFDSLVKPDLPHSISREDHSIFGHIFQEEQTQQLNLNRTGLALIYDINGVDAMLDNPSANRIGDCQSQNANQKEVPDNCILEAKKDVQLGEVADDDGRAAVPIQHKRALIIANSDYQAPIAKLSGVKNDSRAIQQNLAAQGYQVSVVGDADRAAMITALNQLIRDSDVDDSVIVYYAGHGYVHNNSSVGYWLPTNAAVNDVSEWISNVDIARFVRNIAAKQILLVSDSCFSGSLSYEAALQHNKPLDKNAVFKRRSVTVLTSGSEEPVADKGVTGLSPFAAAFIQGINQVATGQDLRGTNLYETVYQQVTSQYPQYPSYGGLASAGHYTGGEYIIEKK